NTCESATCSVDKLLTHSTPFALITEFAKLERLTQTTMVGGSAVTEHTAEQVKPAMPWGPFVAMIDTEDASFDSASRNSSDDIRASCPVDISRLHVPGVAPAEGRIPLCTSIVLSIGLRRAAPRSRMHRCTKIFVIEPEPVATTRAAPREGWLLAVLPEGYASETRWNRSERWAYEQSP